MNISRKYTANLSEYARYHSCPNGKGDFYHREIDACGNKRQVGSIFALRNSHRARNALAGRPAHVLLRNFLEFEVQAGKYFILLFESQEIFHE